MSTKKISEMEPLVPYLKLDGEQPYLVGSKCNECGHTYVGTREVCAKCTARNKMTEVRLAETGTLYDFTVVYRSFPGVDTPFIDAIVDLEDGSHLKGTLLDVEPDPQTIAFDMPVKVVYRQAKPVNGGDKTYFSFFFTPA